MTCLLGAVQLTAMFYSISGGVMSSTTMKRLSSEAMLLSESERAALALDLIRSLDAPAEDGVAEAWDKELVRRISQIDSGQAKLLNRDEFRKRMQARLRQR